jgi:protocatechuate 3,4-dioxygenase beta subunit
MDNDDNPTGQILSRRDALKLLGAGSASLFAWSAAPAAADTLTPNAVAGSALDCIVRPELKIGPYFVDNQLNRSDIRFEPADSSIKAGALLTLNIGVFAVTSGRCIPLEGAQLDVWHCDAQGIYSGIKGWPFDTTGLIFLRGYQLTDPKGQVQFKTIFPGWYSGRTVHIHVMIRTTTAEGQYYEFVSQLFFSDTLTDRIHALKPYVRKEPRNTRNSADSVYAKGGYQLLLNVTGSSSSSYVARINIGLDLANAEAGRADSLIGPGADLPR